MKIQMKFRKLFFLGCLIGVPNFLHADIAHQASGRDLGSRLFQRLAGVPISNSDPRYPAYAAAISKGDLLSAAKIATEDSNFYNITLRNWSAVMANKDGSPLVPLDDFQAMVIGSVRDNQDARTLLTGNFTYSVDASLGFGAPSRSDNNLYQAIDTANLDLSQSLIRVEPQWSDLGAGAEAAGVLTSRSWGALHYSAGTNRRAVAFSMQIFLCAPILTWRNTAIDDFHVRRDVNRKPSGDPSVFQHSCRGCHAPMDAFAGAFAHYDFDVTQGTLNYSGNQSVAPKYNQNANTYPDGWVTTDDSWENMIANNPQFGWRSPATGVGIKDYGTLLANSSQFSRCMALRTFKEVCRRDVTSTDNSAIQTLATNFEAGGYNLKSLFQNVAITPACLGAP